MKNVYHSISHYLCYFVFLVSVILLITSFKNPSVIRTGPTGEIPTEYRRGIHCVILAIIVLGSAYCVIVSLKRDIRMLQSRKRDMNNKSKTV